MSLSALPPALLLVGPTASGKTGLSLEIAERHGCEIISIDSALVYRDMDIGTAKPDASMLRRVPHHLINIIDPDQSYSAAQFRTDARRLMAEISARGHIPLLTGGTLLYVKALREGLADLPVATPELRARIDAEARAKGWPALHTELAAADPVTAARLAPNDAQRIQRALEVYHSSGQTLSEWIRIAKPESQLPCRLLPLAIAPSDRGLLHQRIAARLDAMLADGLIDEVVALRKRYPLTPDMPSMRCVGYRQTLQYLDGEFSRSELRDRCIFATRQLAKRQITWLRGMDDLILEDCFDPRVADNLQAHIDRFLTI